MTESLTNLAFATLAFVGGHFLLSSPALREPLLAKLGAGPFQGLYSLISVAALVWMVAAYISAPRPELWDAPTYIRHLPLSLMLPVFIAMVAALSPKHPALIYVRKPPLEDGPTGIFRITRHPMMWGVGLWALMHVAANGDSASAVFFGGLAVLALLGPMLTERRRARDMGAAWVSYAAASSYVPFAAQISGRSKIVWREIGWLPVIGGSGLYGALLIGHETLQAGDIRDGTNDYRALYRVGRWQEEEKCRECEYLPLCFGGCRDMTRQRDGNFDGVECMKAFYDAVLEESVKMGI